MLLVIGCLLKSRLFYCLLNGLLTASLRHESSSVEPAASGFAVISAV
jgi:hypothetical protein